MLVNEGRIELKMLIWDARHQDDTKGFSVFSSDFEWVVKKFNDEIY